MCQFFDPMPRVLAHRGDSLHYPENTELAFRSAIEMGVDVIETDVRLTKDNRVLIFHDADLLRSCGDPRKIKQLVEEDLVNINAGAKFRAKDSEENPFENDEIHPITLKQALELFPDTKFNIDLKTRSKELAINTAQIIREAKAEGRVCIGSFHHPVLRAFRRAIPEVATSFSPRETLVTIFLHRLGIKPRAIGKRNARVLQVPMSYGPLKVVTPSLKTWCKKHDVVIQVWTINDPKEMKRLLLWGVDGIFTDDPSTLIKTYKGISSILAPPKQMSSS